MGATGTGKSSFINLASGSNLLVSKNLASCTGEIATSTPFELEGRRVVLVDTPGFDDTKRKDTDILKTIIDYLANRYATTITYQSRLTIYYSYHSGKKLAGVLYFHRISDVRMSGISRRNFEFFRQLCGDDTLKNVSLVTNMWGDVSRELAEDRESQLRTEYFAPAITAGARLVRHSNTKQSAHNILRSLVHNTPKPLQIQREIVDQHLNPMDTAIGRVLHQDLLEQERRHQKEKLEMIREMASATERAKEELRQEIRAQEAELERVRGELHTIQNDSGCQII